MRTYRGTSRALDIAASATALILLSPLFALAAICIALDDGGSILYRQRRIGRNGRPFRILKFRSMSAGSTGSAITASGDQRVTRVGAWLRRYKLDELPQFLNVLRGEMSLIGPRPEVPRYVDPSDDTWRCVLQVRPGITDLASLVFRDEEDLFDPTADPDIYYRSVLLPQKLHLNLAYLESRSIRRDLQLLWMTARYSFLPHGFDRERIARAFGATIPASGPAGTFGAQLHA